MGKAGSTKIPEEEDKRLLDRWKKSPLWPVTDEQDTSLSGAPHSLYYSNFCPEAMYDRFGIFVSNLGQYFDEYERDFAHKKLTKEGVGRDNPAWQWNYFPAMHFSECHLHSQLSHDWTKMIPEIKHGIVPSQSNTPELSFDLFLSHASEDKISFVRPLVSELERYGLKVWYDENELKWGDSIRSNIDRGLAHSRYGIVVLSKSFISKKWANAELDALFSREIDTDKVILPVRHGLTIQEVTKFFPTISGKISLSSEDGVECIAKKALDLIRPPAFK